MFFNYHLVIFTDFCTNPNFQFWMGTSYCIHIGIVVVINVAFMITNTIERSKRQKKLNQLRAAQAIMIAEYKAKKNKLKLERLTRRERRAAINKMLDEVMKRPQLPEAILPTVRTQRKLDQANLDKRALESKYETKETLYKELQDAMKTHAKKSEIRKIKKKLRMNKLPTILEHPDEALAIDDEDLDKLIDLDD